MRKRPLIVSPLDWAMRSIPVAPPLIPVLAERGGTQIKSPRAVLLVDSREQDPFDCQPFRPWFSGIKRVALEVGDYAVEGMEDRCVVERKSLSDLRRSFSSDRGTFIARLRRMADYPDRLLVIDAPLCEVKSSSEYPGLNPNQVTQALITSLAALRVPFLCTETHELGAEIVASYLYQVHLLEWLDRNGFGRRISDTDL